MLNPCPGGITETQANQIQEPNLHITYTVDM